MLEILKRALSQALCRHAYEKTGFVETLDPVRNIRYPMRRYECARCHKITWQDGRYDKLSQKI